MWYTLSTHSCRNCGHDCDPLAERCRHCRQHPFVGSELVCGPLTLKQFLTLTGLRLIIAVPILGYLWFVQHNKPGDNWRSYILLPATVLFLLVVFVHAIQILQLCLTRIVMEPEGIAVYRRKARSIQVMQFGWSELDLPMKVEQYRWMRWLGCLMGIAHLLHSLLPEPLSEIRLKSLESDKRFQFPSTASFNREHLFLMQISRNTLSYWLDRRLVTVDPEHQPSKMNRLLQLSVASRHLYACSEGEYQKMLEENEKAHEVAGQEQIQIETEGERILRTMDPNTEEEDFLNLWVPFGKDYLLWVNW